MTVRMQTDESKASDQLAALQADALTLTHREQLQLIKTLQQELTDPDPIVDVTALKNLEAKSAAQKSLLLSISAIGRDFITSPGEGNPFALLLEEFLAVTQSEYGFIGEVLLDGSAPYLLTHAISDIAWNDETRELFQRRAPNFEFRNLDSLFGHALRTGEIVISNNCLTDARSGGLPDGHPPMSSFLGIPLIVGKKMVGLAGVANRKEGYSDELVNMLDPLAAMAAHIIESQRIGLKNKQAAVEQQETLHLLKAIQEANPDLQFVLDHEGTIISYSCRDERQLYIPPQDFLGKPMQDVLPSDIGEKFANGCREASEKGVLVTFEYELPLPQGREFYEGRIASLPDTRILATIRNVSEQKQAKEAMQASNLWRNAVFSALEECVLVVTPDRSLVSVNQAGERMFGYSKEELASLSTEVLHVDREHYVAFGKRIKQAFDRGVSAHFEFEVKRKNGEVFPSEHTVSMLKDNEGEILGLVSVVRDITERRQVEEEQRALERQIQNAQKLESLGVLAGGIAHDFNNILAGLMGQAELGMLNLNSAHPTLPRLRQIIKGVEKATALTRQMLAYSGQGRFVVEKLDVSAILNGMAHLLRTSIPRTISLDLRLDPDLPFINADASQIQQVVINLLSNGSEAIGDHPGRISLSTARMNCSAEDLAQNLATPRSHELPPVPGDYVCLEVSDNGCGMEKETVRKLFEPFFSTKFTGRGLGMAAVLGIVRGHKGVILLDTEPGNGSTLRILWPAVEEKIKVIAAAAPKEPELEANLQTLATILVVDDDEHVRGMMIELLDHLGFEALWATNGRHGIEVFSQHHQEIDCVVLDLTMPELSGEACLEELRRIRGDVKVILTSGYSEFDVAQRFAGKNLDGFLEKPFSVASLKTTLDNVLRSSAR